MALADFLTLELGLAAAIVIVAGLVRGFTGFGGILVMAPPFAHLFGPEETVAIVLILSFISQFQLMPEALAVWRWREILPIAAAATVMLPAGAYVLTTVNPETMKTVIAAAVLICALALMSGWRYSGPPRWWMSLGAGGLSGVMTTSIGAGGPPVILYLMAGPNAPRAVRGSIIVYFALVDTVAIAALTLFGAVQAGTFVRAGLLAPPLMLAAYLGTRAFRVAPVALFRAIALGIVLVSAGVSVLL
jgi:uncharacterized protein